MLQKLAEMKVQILADGEIDDLTQVENDYLEGITGLNETLINPDFDNDLLKSLSWDAAIALGANDLQANIFCGDHKPTPILNLNDLTMTTGYVGSMGKSWETPTTETIEQAISGAMKINDMTREQVVNALAAGLPLKWGQSPNYYYDHSDAVIGRKRSAPKIELVKCQCGHSVPQALVMSASMGTSCPDCYDRMS